MKELVFENILIEKPVVFDQVKIYARQGYGDMVKAVVDVQMGILVLGAEMHSDEEGFLIDRGSKQQDLWGINIWVPKSYPQSVEFDSMINLRPGQGNKSRFVEDENIRKKILEIVKHLIYGTV